MARLTRVGILAALILAAVEIALLGPVAFAQSRNVVVGRPAPPPKSAKTVKRTWQSGPATTPPEIEIVPRRAAFPRPVNSGSGPEGRSKVQPPAASVGPAEASRQSVVRNPSSQIGLVTRYGRTNSKHRAIATVEDSLTKPTRPDPVASARSDLTGLRDDPKARQAFYDELRRTADRVRAGK